MAKSGITPANEAAEQATAAGVTLADFQELRSSVQVLVEQLAEQRDVNRQLLQRLGEADAAGNPVKKSRLAPDHDLIAPGYTGPTWWVQLQHNPRVLVGRPTVGDAIHTYRQYFGVRHSDHQEVTSPGPAQVDPKPEPPAPPAPAPVVSQTPAPPAAAPAAQPAATPA